MIDLESNDILHLNVIPNNSSSNTLDNQVTEENKTEQVHVHNKKFQHRTRKAETTIDDENINIKENRQYLDKKDLINRENARLACLIRKKYTALMKESIRNKGKVEKYQCCSFIRKMSSKVFQQLAGTLFQALISLIAIVVYVVGTYYPDDSELENISEEDRTIVIALKWTDVAVAIMITLDYIYNLITANRKLKFAFSFLSLMDLVTVIPIYVNLTISSSKSLSFARIFRIIRIMRVFRLYKILSENKRKDNNEESRSEVNRRLIRAVLTVLAVVFLSTGIIHFLNDTFPEYFRIVIPSLDTMTCASGKNFTQTDLDATTEGITMELKCPPGDSIVKVRGKLTFDLAFYYMVITMATVGYGDIYPDTTWSRLIIAIFVIISIITISKQTSDLNDLVKLNTEYQVAYKEAKGTKHVILTGFYSKYSLLRFLNEFYHIDHKEKSEHTKIVIIQSEFPDKEILSILLNPKFEEYLHYIIGDIFLERTLQLAKVATASGVFLISDQNNSDANKNDQFLILACKAVSQHSQAPLYVQFNSSQSLLHDWADWDFACSTQQIKMSIIVKNGFVSGFSTMIMNLSSSSSSFYNSDIKETPWMLEYIHGASQEIYIIDVPKDFTPVDFSKFSLRAYLDHGSLVIGLKKKKVSQEDKDIVYYVFLLNPIDHLITNEDSLIVISADYESAMGIFQSSKRHKGMSQVLDEPTMLKFLKTNFRDENEGIKEGSNLANLDVENIEFNRPEIFNKRQHFKIWESHNELDTYLDEHYLVFGKEEHLWEFMTCFNRFYSELIFFISDQHPTAKWDMIKRYFKNLVYIECSYSDQDDLSKLQLNKAKHVFILTYAVENSGVSDSGILPLVKIIEENYSKCKYTLELADELNVRYLNSKGIEEGIYDNPKGNKDGDMIKKKTKNAARLPVRLWPKYAKSDIFFSNSLESLLAFSYHNDGLLDVLTKFLGLGHGTGKDESKENNCVSIYRFVGETSDRVLFEKVTTHFFNLKPPVIPIAVYRMKKEKELKNESPYVITNPKKDLEMNKYDKIICLGKPEGKIFQILEEGEIEEDNSSFESFEDNSQELEKKKKKNSYRKNYDRQSSCEDLDNLDEDQLIEKLRQEIKNLKQLSKQEIKDTRGSTQYLKGLSNFKNNFKVIDEEYEEVNNKKKEKEENYINSVNSSNVVEEEEDLDGIVFTKRESLPLYDANNQEEPKPSSMGENNNQININTNTNVQRSELPHTFFNLQVNSVENINITKD